MFSGTYKVECLRHLFLIADALVAHLEVVDLGYCQGQAEAWFRALDGANSVDFFSCVSVSLSCSPQTGARGEGKRKVHPM